MSTSKSVYIKMHDLIKAVFCFLFSIYYYVWMLCFIVVLLL